MTDQLQPCAFAHRLRIARRSAGYTKSSMARVLNIPRRLYVAYEGGAPFPGHLLPALCALTRCSKQYFCSGKGFGQHRAEYHSAGNLVVRLNLCGEPCTIGKSWCLEGCLDHTT